MDKAERYKFKQLANDAVIETFGPDSPAQRVALALERCVDELEEANTKCLTCSVCADHGDMEDESVHVDPSEVLGIHAELKKLLGKFKEYHVKLAEELAGAEFDDQLADSLATLIEDTEEQLDELEGAVIP